MAGDDLTGRYFVGLISGTSMDGIDAALVSFGDHSCNILQTHSHQYSDDLRTRLTTCKQSPGLVAVDELADIDREVGLAFAAATNKLIQKAGVDKQDIAAVGSHGQTIYHMPPVSVQIGDPNLIATMTGIRAVADFRRRDLSLGGEGAPLAPAFHQWLYADSGQVTGVLNLGGIANITVVDKNPDKTTGFDTGPASTLMDAWIREHRGAEFDADGEWARSGKVVGELLEKLLADPYLAETPPKSTGFEHYNLDWLRKTGGDLSLWPVEDVQATLLAFTVHSIVQAINDYCPNLDRLLVCGGGVHNVALMQDLATTLPGVEVESTASAGVLPDWMEAAAFGWLAMRTLRGEPGNLPSVTGASESAVLGAIYPASH